MLAFIQKQIHMIRPWTLIEISEMYTKTFKISTLWVNRQIGKGVNSSVFHRLITIHVTFIPEVVYITHEKSESRINFKSGKSFTSSSITSNWNGKIITRFYIILQFKNHNQKIFVLKVFSNNRVFHQHLPSQEKTMSILIVKLDSIGSNQKELQK